MLSIKYSGVATSGIYIHGKYVYNPYDNESITDTVSRTVVSPTIYDADRFATVAFTMRREDISFIESLCEVEEYVL